MHLLAGRLIDHSAMLQGLVVRSGDVPETVEPMI